MGLNLPALLASMLVFTAVAVPGRGRGRSRRRLDTGGRLERRRPTGALAALGRRVSGSAPEDDAVVGAAVLIVVAAATGFGPLGALGALGVAAASVRVRRRARLRRREALIEQGLPEMVELLRLVVGAGRTTAAALADIAPRSPEPFRSELAGVLRRRAAGEPLVESLHRLHRSLGPSVGPVVYACIAAEADGAPLVPALERAADEAHRRRRVRAEEAARRVPVLMLFPLVFCILPAFCLMTVVPLLLGSIADLQLPG